MNWEILELIVEKEISDVGGKIIFLKYDAKNLNIVEIKKGFSRGDHYHICETRQKSYSSTECPEYRSMSSKKCHD